MQAVRTNVRAQQNQKIHGEEEKAKLGQKLDPAQRKGQKKPDMHAPFLLFLPDAVSRCAAQSDDAKI